MLEKEKLDWLFVINPVSGALDKTFFIDKIKSKMKGANLNYRLYFTTGHSDEESIKLFVDHFKPEKIGVVGGDGTVLDVVKCVKDDPIPVAIIPFGSANGMSVELDIEQNPEVRLNEIIRDGEVKDFDLIWFGDNIYSLHISDVGLNAEVVSAYDKDEDRGMRTYLKHLISVWSAKKQFEVEILADGKKYHREVFMLVIANSRKYGTGMLINPNGRPDDGKFEICLVKELSIDGMIKAGLSSINERFVPLESLEIIQCKEAEINLTDKKVFQVDGEVVGKLDYINPKIVPSAVKLIL
ncbi:diacylglycerol/lipid kinase family protein [Marinigracilibium pacificum]|uniref:Diacylglycerol kinase n=1 Tax=Marinigracilibium pacificum TaxID=2729599 RepID=A0A848J143_9BACT|nr:diacylglycerol kinase family protein [Marinigracilibium pacificum]NMM50513.1 diacylglycerol kinase [Marinigracilibium pacificum]